jgi:hypothetical protein
MSKGLRSCEHELDITNCTICSPNTEAVKVRADALAIAEKERDKALKVWAEQVKRAEKATERANIAEARNEAALVLSDVGAEGEKRGERVGPQFAECISAILRGEYDE